MIDSQTNKVMKHLMGLPNEMGKVENKKKKKLNPKNL